MSSHAGTTRTEHVALVVEDDPAIALILKQLVTSMGHLWLYASTLEETLSLVAAGGYCYVLLDMQIPANAGSDPIVGCGETALRAIRRAALQRTPSGRHVLPIVVVTSYATSDPEFISKMYDMDANAFIPKPFRVDRLDIVLDKIRAALTRSEREAHDASCGGRGAAGAPVVGQAEARGAAAIEAPTVRLVIDGVFSAGRTEVWIDGARGSLQDLNFEMFLKLVVVHLRTPGEWAPGSKLGVVRNTHGPSRIRAELKALVPEGFALVETSKGVGYRLGAGVVVERVAWGKLATHPQAGVRKVAGEWRQ